jgi:RHS repeat-associated protein
MGESWYNASNDKLYFTTYEYDSESGNHYAMARYHVSRLGRLSSPDPLSGITADPQSLNRYSYSVNDPANLTDPSGLCPRDTVQEHPTDSSQQTSGEGPSVTDSGEGEPNAQLPSPCQLYPTMGGGDIFLDGADISDTSGVPGMGTPIGSNAWAKIPVAVQKPGDWDWEAGGWLFFTPGFSMNASGIGPGGGGDDRASLTKKQIQEICDAIRANGGGFVPVSSGTNVIFDNNALLSGFTVSGPEQFKSLTVSGTIILIPPNTQIGVTWQNGKIPGSFQMQSTQPIGVVSPGKPSVTLTGLSFNDGSFSVSGKVADVPFTSGLIENKLNTNFSTVLAATDLANKLAKTQIPCEAVLGTILGGNQ